MRSVIYRLRQDAYGLVIHRRWLQKGAFRVDGKRFICFAANYLVKETIQTCARGATVTPNLQRSRGVTQLCFPKLTRADSKMQFGTSDPVFTQIRRVLRDVLKILGDSKSRR